MIIQYVFGISSGPFYPYELDGSFLHLRAIRFSLSFIFSSFKSFGKKANSANPDEMPPNTKIESAWYPQFNKWILPNDEWNNPFVLNRLKEKYAFICK